MADKKKITHFDDEGRSRMVDISEKGHTLREAIAKGSIIMKEQTLKQIMDKSLSKGDVLEVARLAAIMGAKKTPDLIPLCQSAVSVKRVLRWRL